MPAKRGSIAFRFFCTARPIYWAGLTAVLGLSIAVIAAATIQAARATPEQWQKSVVIVQTDILEEPLPGVLIPAKNVGTGFALNGRIYTCEHVIHDGKNIEVILRNGHLEPAKLIRSDKRFDLAELAVKQPPKSLKLSSRPPHFFERVWQIGHPGPLRWVVTNGFFLSFSGEANCFILDTWFGNSGSPILDGSGAVMGMTHAVIPGSRFTLGGTLEGLRNFVYPDRPR